jgi:LysM repeat protein
MRRSLLAAAVLAVGIAACGSSSTPGPSASSSAAPSGAPAASASIAPAQSAEASPAGTVYVVKKGDTLYAIAVRNGTTVKAILAVNPDITNPSLLKVGQRILVPAPTSSP